MRLQLLSDVHFEFHRDGGRSFVDSHDPTGIDVLVLAGDLAIAEGIPPALALLCGRFRDASVVYVHGNHEFYDSDRNSVVDITKRAQAENPNLVWLDSSGTQLFGFNFLGAPLWFPRSTVDERLKRAMNDFSAIEDFESWVYAENARAVAFFERQLRPGDIVVTHHLPSQRCVAPQFAGHSLNPFFVCDLTRLIIERRPRLWLHGHSSSPKTRTAGPRPPTAAPPLSSTPPTIPPRWIFAPPTVPSSTPSVPGPFACANAHARLGTCSPSAPSHRSCLSKKRPDPAGATVLASPPGKRLGQSPVRRHH